MTSEFDPPDGLPLDVRVERLEHAILKLSAELAALRAEIATGRASAAPASAPTSRSTMARPGPTAARSSVRGAIGRSRYLGESLDLERLLGRYGMLGIAVLAAAAAVGTFLS